MLYPSLKFTGLVAILLGLNVLSGALQGPTAWSDPALSRGPQATVPGALDYQMGEGATQNPWIVLACHWPSSDPAALAVLERTPPAGAREHFEHWVRGIASQQWLPAGFPEAVPYLEGWGFVSIKEAPAYRVRVREATKPAYTGSTITTKAIVMAVEPLDGPIPLPESESAMMSLAAQFLGPAVPVSSAGDQAPPHFIASPGARYLNRYPGSASLPIELSVWTDGHIVLVALYEDVPYGSGPTPPPRVRPVAPTSEGAQIRAYLTPEELQQELQVGADGPTPEIIVIREKTPRVSPSEAPIQVNVPAVAQAINGLPPILGRDVLAQPSALPRLNADAPAYPVLLSSRTGVPVALAADARDVLQSTWVPSPDSMPNSMLYLYNWPAPPMVTALAKYQVGGVVVFIAASNWGTTASVATSPGARTHSLATHQALAEQTLELCRRFLAPAHVPPAADAIVEHTKFSLLPDGRTGVLWGHFGNLTIWSDGDTLATYLVRTDRAITTLSPGHAQAPTPMVTVNGRGLIPDGDQTATEHGITSVALRPFCEGVGASVYWIPASRAAIVARQGKAAWFQEGNQTAVLDGVETPLPVAPYIHEGKMMVPLDPLVAWLGGTLARDEQTHTIQVTLLAGVGRDEGRTPVGVGGTATTWNDFSLEGFSPTAEEVASCLAADVPEREKATCEARVRRALQSSLTPIDLRERLLPLRGWGGSNVFLARCRFGDYWVQITEGAARLTVELRRADGEPPVPGGANAETVALDLAKQLFNPAMLPRELHQSASRHAPKCADWLTNDQPGPEGFVMNVVEAFADGATLHFVLWEVNRTSPVAPGIPFYTFANPPMVSEQPVPAPVPERKPPAPSTSQLTPEELAHEVN